jgi:hydroxymethylglutaryl-CoA reductase
MIGQVQLVGLEDVAKAAMKIEQERAELVSIGNTHATHLKAYGGGVTGVQARTILTPRGPMLIVEFLVNVIDAMGANAVNTILEKMAPVLEERTGGKSRLKILTNLATHRMSSATAVWKVADIGGPDVAEGILDGWTMAMSDPYRRATHNKGVMNGIDAVAVACGQDWRAVEAGAHAYAALKGAALTSYRLNADGDIEGKITLPLAVGTVGGSMKANPTASMCLKILGVKSSGELAQVMAAVGLAQNFAALRAMASEGIQKGHMRLHARHIASSAGAKPGEMDEVVERMSAANTINEAGAKAALEQIRKPKTKKR